MALVINTNVMSLNAQRNLTTSGNQLATALQRLSSGLRINSAKDDAAGLAIVERFTSQIRGLNQAARNANDGISLAQTAEGALTEVSNNLQRIRELAVQALNATNSPEDRAALDAEVQQLKAEIERVATSTAFNGVKLLDGSFERMVFQVGANAGDEISVDSIASARTSHLGRHSLTAEGTVTGKVVTGTVDNGVAAATNLTITTAAGTTSPISYAANSGADAIAAAINSAAAAIGVTATATNETTLGGLNAAGTVSFTLNGTAVSVTIQDQNDLSSLVSAINGVSADTGVTATFESASTKNSIKLTTLDGRNIVIEDFAHSVAGSTVQFGGATLTDGGTVDAVKTGVVVLTSSKGRISTANAGSDVFAAAGVNHSSFASLAAVDIRSVDSAKSALEVIDAALATVNNTRADLGAYQNRFQTAIANIQIMAENLSASRSRIQDADFAAETANLTRAQILQQAGTAIVAQANAVPQNVLSLLR